MSDDLFEKEKNLKLMIMGRSGAGKTSMQSIIFANFSPNETERIGFTQDVNVGKFRFLGMSLVISDCAGYRRPD